MSVRTEYTAAAILGVSHSAQHFYMRLVPTLIPVLTVDLRLPLWQLGLLVSVYSISDGLAQAPVGVLSDRHDRKYILTTGIALLGVGYLVFGSAPVLGSDEVAFVLANHPIDGVFLVMVLSMAVAGVGGSVLHPVGYPMITANMSPERRGKGLGIWGSAAKFGDAAAPLLMGIAILVLAWERILLLLGVAGLVYAALLFVVLSGDAFRTLPHGHADSERTAETTDVWDIDRRRYVYPIVVVSLFFVTRVIVTKGIDTYVPTFITDVYGYSLTVGSVYLPPASFANFYFSALLIVAGVVQLLTGDLTDRYDPRVVLIGFLLASAAAIALLFALPLSPLALLAVLLVTGAGLWGLNPARDALVSDITPPEREGRTFGYLWSFTQIVGSLSPIVIGVVAGTAGIRQGFGWLALVSLVAAGVVALLFSDRVYVDPSEASAGAD